jgi:MFS family permease
VTRGLRLVAATFACFGFFWGSWAVAALDVQLFLHLSDGGFGLLLAVTVLGGAAANVVGGTIAERHGTRAVLAAVLTIWGAFLVVLAVTNHELGFEALFVIVVSVGGMVDVVMNVAATAGLGGSPGKLLRFHALFNGGAVVGAGVTGILLETDTSWRVVWVTTGVVALVLAALCLRADLPAGERGEQHTIREGLAALRRARLLSLAIVFACGALVEGGIGTWGVLFLRSKLEAAALVGAGAYVFGQVLATVARASLGPMANRVGERLGSRLGTGLACVGIAVEATAGSPAIAGIGLTAAAVGASVYWPLLLALAGRGSDRPGVVIGGVSAAGYLGFLAGPPLVGWIADGFGLRAGLFVLVAAALAATIIPIRPVRASQLAST